MRYRAPRSAAVHPDQFLSLESRTLLDGSPLPTLAMLESPTNAVVRMETTYGDIDIELFNTDAPLTTAGFLDTLRRGDYSQTFFHNLVAGSTLSGGLYSFDDANGLHLRDEPFEVDANFARSNVERTIAVPFTAGTPNTTPGGFVFNLADNSANANGNFVVFGRVIQGWSVITTIAALPVADLSGFFIGNPAGANLTSVPIAQANPTAMSEDLLVPLTDVQIIKPAGNTGFYSSRLYMPEGYSWERIFESVELMNPGSQSSDYQILVRYANDTDNRDQVIAAGTLDADRRTTVVVAPGFGQRSTVVRNYEPYAYEVWSTTPIVAGFRHKDFKAGTGETFFRPESLSDPMAMRDWTFTQTALGFGSSQVFLVWQNITGADANVTVTLYFDDIGPIDMTISTEAHRRGGINLRDLTTIPAGHDFVGARIQSDQNIVAAISRYDQRSGGNNGDEGAILALGTPGGGAVSGLAPGSRRGGLDPVIVLNTSSAPANITFFVLEEGETIPVERQVTVPAGRILVLDDDNNPSTAAPPGKFFSLRYTSDVPVTVGITTSAFRGTGTGLSPYAALETHFADGRAFTAPAGSPFGQQGLSVFNPNTGDATVRITFRFDDNTSLTTDPFTVGAGESIHRRINQYASELAQHLNGLGGLMQKPYSLTLLSDIPVVSQVTQLTGDGKAELGMTLGQWTALSPSV